MLNPPSPSSAAADAPRTALGRGFPTPTHSTPKTAARRPLARTLPEPPPFSPSMLRKQAPKRHHLR